MTSPVELIEVICPKCNSLFQDWYRASINLNLGESWTDEQIRKAMSVTCPGCGEVTDMGGLVVNRQGGERGTMMAMAHTADGLPGPPIRIGRVYADHVEVFWMSDRTWTSDADPERAERLTIFRYGREPFTEPGTPHEAVMQEVAELFDAKWEFVVRRFTKPIR